MRAVPCSPEALKDVALCPNLGMCSWIKIASITVPGPKSRNLYERKFDSLFILYLGILRACQLPQCEVSQISACHVLAMGRGFDEQVLLSKNIPADRNGASDTRLQQNFSPQGNELECKSLGLVFDGFWAFSGIAVFDGFWAFSGIAVAFMHVLICSAQPQQPCFVTHFQALSCASAFPTSNQTNATDRCNTPFSVATCATSQRTGCCPEGIDACLIDVIYPYTTAIIPSPTLV